MARMALLQLGYKPQFRDVSVHRRCQSNVWLHPHARTGRFAIFGAAGKHAAAAQAEPLPVRVRVRLISQQAVVL